MLQKYSSDHSDSASDNSYDAWEQAVLAHVPSLPREIQTHIASFCDVPTLGALCQVNRQWYSDANPLLWRHISFVNAFSDEDQIEATRLFFSVCEKMRDSDPERFLSLASRVWTLDIGRLFGINIVHNDDADIFAYYSRGSNEKKRCVFDLIAEFRNLISLSVYIKSWWGYDDHLKETGKALAENLKSLQSLKVGGQMSPDILDGLMGRAEGLRDMTLINLINTPGQGTGPDPVTFLTEDMCERFTSLKTLHLVKFADLQGPDIDLSPDGEDFEADVEYPSGMLWRFPREQEVGALQEWAMLLRHTSKTLQSVTLENRYLCSWGWEKERGQFIEPGKTHPDSDDWGSNSIAQSQRILFPVFFNEKWPKLQELYLVGMGPAKVVHESVAHLKDRVRVVSGMARFQIMTGDVTPDDVSTPIEFMCVWEDVDKHRVDADSDEELSDCDDEGDEDESDEED